MRGLLCVESRGNSRTATFVTIFRLFHSIRVLDPARDRSNCKGGRRGVVDFGGAPNEENPMYVVAVYSIDKGSKTSHF